MKLKAGELEKLTNPKKIITPEEARHMKPGPERRMRFPRLSAFAIAALASMAAMKGKSALADTPANPPAATAPASAGQNPPAGNPDPYARPENAPTNPDTSPYPGQENVQPPEDRIFFTNFSLQPMGEPRSIYDDSAPGIILPEGLMRSRGISNNEWDMGGALIGNEAGMAVRAHASWRDIITMDAGNIWLNGVAVPFGGFAASGEINAWRFGLRGFANLHGAGGLPSYLFTSLSAAFKFSFPFQLDSSNESRILRLNLGMAGGGAFDYPNFMDYHFNMVPGLSLRLDGYPDSRFSYALYGLSTFYFCAPTPPETASAAHFQPFFQHAEVGFNARIFQDFNLGAFAQFGGLDNIYAFRGSWNWDINGRARGLLFLELGADHHTGPFEDVFGPFLLIGARITYGGEHMNSTNASSYSNHGDFTRQGAGTIIAASSPGVYGFGRSGDPSWDVPINRAKSRILSSSGFDDFASSYADAPFDEKLRVARFLTAFLGQVAYANGATEALFSGDLFADEVERIASASLDDIMGWMREYITWYNSRGSGDQMPENLRDGIAICAGIHWLAAKFFSQNGVDAAAVGGVNTDGGPHVVTVIRNEEGRYVLIDYGKVYEADSFRSVLREYGRARGIPSFRVYVFGPDHFVGVERTAEGRLMEAVMGLDNEQITRGYVLGIE